MQSPQQNTEPDHLGGSVIYSIGGFLGATLGAAIGGMSGFVLPEPYYKLTNPEILKDGQWGMIYLSTIPTGIVIGLILGLLVGLLVANKIK